MYIVLEGIVGAGKSTQAQKLREYFQDLGKGVISIREPGSTPIAEDIRSLAQVKEWKDDIMHPLTNAYLYAAARAQTLISVVHPAIKRGDIVISDRSFLSSLAYQGEAQNLGFDQVLAINSFAIDEILPDKIFYLDIDIDTALSRTFDTAGDKWEKMERDFFQRIVHGYEKCEKLDILKGRFIRIDANTSKENITEQILTYL